MKASITLKQTCWALQEPVTGLHFKMCGTRPTLRPGLLGTLFPSIESAARCAADRLSGIPHDLVRIDS